MIKKDGRLVKRFWFQIYECSRVENFLSDMLKNGWMLEKFEGNKFTFLPCNPAELRFSVNIFEDTSKSNSFKNEATCTYIEYCEKAEWSFIGNCNKVYIFYTKNSNAVPIETDDELTLHIINRNILKDNLFNWFILPILNFTSTATQMDHFKTFISSYLSIATVFTWLLLTINAIVGMTIYSRWYYASKKRIKKREVFKYYDGKNRSILIVINLLLGSGVLFLLIIAGIMTGDFISLAILIIILIVLSYVIYKSISEGRGKRKKLIVLITMIFAKIGIVSLLTAITIRSGQDFSNRNEILMYMEDGSLTFTIIEHDKVPVTLEDYGFTQKNITETSKETIAYADATIFAQSYAYSDYYITKDKDYLSGINYELFESDFQWVIDKYLKDEWLDNEYNINLSEEEPPLFKADKLYVQRFDNNAGYRYIAVYGKKVLILELDQEPTSKQIDLFLNKLIYS